MLQQPHIDVSSEGGLTPPSMKGNIELRNVQFVYPSRPDVHVSVATAELTETSLIIVPQCMSIRVLQKKLFLSDRLASCPIRCHLT